jgi:hypothetical protein
MQEAHPFAGEQIAADAEGLDRRIEALQLAKDFGGVEITGCLTGDDGEFHQ